MGCGVGGCACADEAGSEEGVYGDKVGGFLEYGVGKGADGELGTDKGGQVAEGEFSSGVRGVNKACAVEKVRIGVSRCSETNLERNQKPKKKMSEKRRREEKKADGR